MAKNSAVDHETAVQVVDFFQSHVKKIERKVMSRVGFVSRDSQRRIVQGVDRMIEAEFGFPMHALFEIV